MLIKIKATNKNLSWFLWKHILIREEFLLVYG